MSSVLVMAGYGCRSASEYLGVDPCYCLRGDHPRFLFFYNNVFLGKHMNIIYICDLMLGSRTRASADRSPNCH